jgi:hypothetical protein
MSPQLGDTQKRNRPANAAIARRAFLKTASLMTAGIGVFSEVLMGASRFRQTPKDAGSPVLGSPGTRFQWPQRALLQEDLSNSMESRFLAKTVQDFLVIDDMERETGWTASQTVQMEYTTDRSRTGTRSLRFRTAQWDPRYAGGGGMMRGGIFDDLPPFAPSIHLKFGSPQDWSRFNRLSIWCYVHPTEVPYHSLRFQIFCEDAPTGPSDPVAIHFIGGMRPGQWNLITWEIPELRRDQVSEIAILRPLWGFSRSSMHGDIVYDFDQLRVERVEPKPYEGWQPAPDTISFNHVGYLPSAKKLAFMGGVGASEFQLLNDSSGTAAVTLPVSKISNRLGSFLVLDFTSFTAPGKYRLRCGDVTSRSFSLSEDVWDGTVLKALNYFYGDRCGFEVAGMHDACHLDTTVSHEGVVKCVAGGWHDAGNMTQGSYRTDLCASAMLRFYDRLLERDLKPELRARLLEEAHWGLEWGLRTRIGGGWRSAVGGCSYFTDSIVGTADDASFAASRVPLENFIGAGTAAHASRVLQTVDPAFAEQLLAAAEDDFGAAMEDRKQPPLQNHPAPVHRGCWRDEVAYAILAAVELYRATGRQRYAADAQRLGGLLLEMQEQRFVDGIPVTGYFYEDANRTRIVHDTHSSFEEAPVAALRELCDAFAQHADWAQWYAGVLLHSEFFLNRGARITSPFGMVPAAVWRRSEIEEWSAGSSSSMGRGRGALPPALAHLAPSPSEEFRGECMRMFDEGVHLGADYRLRAFPILNDKLGHGNGNIQLAMTAGLAAAAELRNATEISQLAARQLQWLFGGNPFSQTLMYGEGYDYQRLVAEAVPDLVGVMPLGIDSHHGDAPLWTQTAAWAPKDLWVVTTGRTILALSHAAIPGRVIGEAPAGATFRETLTGKITRIAKGRFAVNLAPGQYAVQYAGQKKSLAIVSGASYTLNLDPRNALEMELSVGTPQDQTVPVTARLSGTGTHRLELRSFNCSPEQPRIELKLKAGRSESLEWKLRIADSEKPWVLIVIPDGLNSHKQEAFGAVRHIDDAALSS